MINQTDLSIRQQFDHLPPMAIEAERCVIACLMLAGDNVALRCETAEGLIPAHFASLDNKAIFESITTMIRRGDAIDAISVREHLIGRKKFDEVGGNVYLGDILNTVPSPVHGPHYAKIVKDRAMRRALIAQANEITRAVYAATDDDNATDIGQAAVSNLSALLARRATSGIRHIGDVLMEVYEKLEKANPDTILTGLHDLDEVTGGIMRGEEVIIASRPSMGKSCLARQIAVNAVMNGTRVGFISNEESSAKIGRNMLSSVGRIDSQKLRRPQTIAATEWRSITDGISTLAACPLFVCDKAGTINDVLAASSLMVARHGCEVIIIDYLQRIGGSRGRSEYERVSEASMAVSNQIRELNVAGIVTAQLNRGTESRDDKHPCMADLRSSGQIEQDADGVILLYREDYYRATDPDRKTEPLDNIAELIIGKWRDGVRGGTVCLKARLRNQAFDNYPVTPFGGS